MAAERGVVLVTGAGRGIGRHIALALSAAGYPLLLASRSAEPLAETHRECAAGVPVESVVVDVRDPAQVRGLGERLDSRPLHAVVNNAGIGTWAPLETVDVGDWDAQVHTNARAAFLVARETVPLFKRQGRGLYLHVGSDCSLVGKPNRAAYTVAKHALAGLAHAMRAELLEHGIHTTMLYAGRTDTWFRGHRPGDRPGALAAEQVAELARFVIDAYPRFWVADATVFSPGEHLNGPRGIC